MKLNVRIVVQMSFVIMNMRKEMVIMMNWKRVMRKRKMIIYDILVMWSHQNTT